MQTKKGIIPMKKEEPTNQTANVNKSYAEIALFQSVAKTLLNQAEIPYSAFHLALHQCLRKNKIDEIMQDYQEETVKLNLKYCEKGERNVGKKNERGELEFSTDNQRIKNKEMRSLEAKQVEIIPFIVSEHPEKVPYMDLMALDGFVVDIESFFKAKPIKKAEEEQIN